MPYKRQATFLNSYISDNLDRLSKWAGNPWRRYSLLLIIFLLGFFLGSSLGMINGVLALSDLLGALATIIVLELLVRVRFTWNVKRRPVIILSIIDMLRIGMIYGLFNEALKIM